MDQPRRCCTRSAGKVGHIHEGCRHALRRQIAQNADAIDAAADDQDVA